MNPGDALYALIRQAVSQRVPAADVDRVAQIVAYTVASIMSEPQFFEQLAQVRELRQENELLRQHLAVASAALYRVTPVAKKATTKKAAARKRVVKRSPTVQVRGSSATNRRNFQQGFKGK